MAATSSDKLQSSNVSTTTAGAKTPQQLRKRKKHTAASANKPVTDLSSTVSATPSPILQSSTTMLDSTASKQQSPIGTVIKQFQQQYKSDEQDSSNNSSVINSKEVKVPMSGTSDEYVKVKMDRNDIENVGNMGNKLKFRKTSCTNIADIIPLADHRNADTVEIPIELIGTEMMIHDVSSKKSVLFISLFLFLLEWNLYRLGMCFHVYIFIEMK